MPFTIYTVDGGAMRVPTVDHVYVQPTGSRVFVSFDDGRNDAIRPLMISRVSVDQQTNGAHSEA